MFGRAPWSFLRCPLTGPLRTSFLFFSPYFSRCSICLKRDESEGEARHEMMPNFNCVTRFVSRNSERKRDHSVQINFVFGDRSDKIVGRLLSGVHFKDDVRRRVGN